MNWTHVLSLQSTNYNEILIQMKCIPTRDQNTREMQKDEVILNILRYTRRLWRWTWSSLHRRTALRLWTSQAELWWTVSAHTVSIGIQIRVGDFTISLRLAQKGSVFSHGLRLYPCQQYTFTQDFSHSRPPPLPTWWPTAPTPIEIWS